VRGSAEDSAAAAAAAAAATATAGVGTIRRSFVCKKCSLSPPPVKSIRRKNVPFAPALFYIESVHVSLVVARGHLAAHANEMGTPSSSLDKEGKAGGRRPNLRAQVKV